MAKRAPAIDPEKHLSELLEGESPMQETRATLRDTISNAVQKVREKTATAPSVSQDTHAQWAIGGNGKYFPVGTTASILPAGVYMPFASGDAYGMELMKVQSDSVYRLPDMATEMILNEADTFWKSEEKYRAHHLLYKRGLLMWGPPGGGKTVTVKLLMQELVKRDGIVVVVSNVGLAILVLKAFRRIERDRNLIVVFEDIDEIIRYNGEASVLSMLDGEDNIDKVLNLATTNHPELLGARIVNRPSRFDRRIFVGMPGEAARSEYLLKATSQGLKGKDLKRWVRDTEKMSIAHLRELVAAVYCLGQPYEEVIERLGAMQVRPKEDPSTSGFLNSRAGFQAGFGAPSNGDPE
jgi:predicted AAA+ superfamily ATPase